MYEFLCQSGTYTLDKHTLPSVSRVFHAEHFSILRTSMIPGTQVVFHVEHFSYSPSPRTRCVEVFHVEHSIQLHQNRELHSQTRSNYSGPQRLT